MISFLSKLFGKQQQTTQPQIISHKPQTTNSPTSHKPQTTDSQPQITSPRDYMPQAQQFMQDPPKDQIITIEELKAEHEKGKKELLIDVRQPNEVAEGKIPGAVPIPLGELGERLSELPQKKETSIITVCAHGGRAAAALLFLKDKGYKKVRAVMGGTAGWIDAGYEVE